jgi:hypothetical protein
LGISLAWVAIEAAAPEDIRPLLGLAETGSGGNFYSFPIADISLANGWYLLTAMRCDHAIRSDRTLSKLSITNTVVACSIEEHVMFISASLWRDGNELWSVTHRGGDFGDTDLVVKGAPPDNFEDVRARCFSAQEQGRHDILRVDYVADIPLILAESITGFRHDTSNPEIVASGFRALQQESTGLLGPSTKPKWKFW